jgi:hypothetical protein
MQYFCPLKCSDRAEKIKDIYLNLWGCMRYFMRVLYALIIKVNI